MHLFQFNILIFNFFDVFYLFRTRVFIFRKTDVYTVMVHTADTDACTTYHTVTAYTNRLP